MNSLCLDSYRIDWNVFIPMGLMLIGGVFIRLWGLGSTGCRTEIGSLIVETFYFLPSFFFLFFTDFVD